MPVVEESIESETRRAPQAEERVGRDVDTSGTEAVLARVDGEEEMTGAVDIGVSRFVEVFRLRSDGASGGEGQCESVRLSSCDDDDAAAETTPPARLSQEVISPCRRASVVAKLRLFDELAAPTSSEEDDGGSAGERTRKSVVFVATLLLSLFVLGSSVLLLAGSYGGMPPKPNDEDVPRRRVNIGRYIDFQR